MTTADQSMSSEIPRPAAQNTRHPSANLPKELRDALAVLTPGMNYRDLGEKLGYSPGEARAIWDELRRYGKLHTSGPAGTPAARPDLHPVPRPAQEGFLERPRKGGKSYWDWLDLDAKLAIPIVVALATIGFGLLQQHLADVQHQQDHSIALDQQRAAILQTYIDNIQDLLLNHHLLNSSSRDDGAVLARARTLTALQGLDPERKGRLLQFLYEARLIGYFEPIGPLVDDFKIFPPVMDLSEADFSGADLSGAGLAGAALAFVDLRGANLSGAFLIGATFLGADLRGANLRGANLRDVDLVSADLRGAGLDPGGTRVSYLSGCQIARRSKMLG